MSLNWNFEPPPPSEFADREVRLTGFSFIRKANCFADNRKHSCLSNAGSDS